ncbi:MAG: YceI family protein [Rubricoccaceae bacterium]|nr:YceI family protein [Rubricoccaceae bacterium]
MHLFKIASGCSLVTIFTLLSACAEIGDAPRAEISEASSDSIATTMFSGQPLAIDTTNSSIAWTAAKVTRTHQGGFADFSGSVYLNNESVSGVEMHILAASIFSDTERLTGHLRSEDFFEVERFPDATFAASSFEPLEGDSTATHTVTGELTIRDQTNRISFPAAISVDADSVHTTADFIIDRQLWGLSYPGAPDDLIYDDVRIRLNVAIARSPHVVRAE